MFLKDLYCRHVKTRFCLEKGWPITTQSPPLNISKKKCLWKHLVTSIFSVNPFPNKPWFSHVCSLSPLKTLWEKEKLLVTSISPFPTVFSTRLDNCHFHQIWNCCLQTLSVWKSLKFAVWERFNNNIFHPSWNIIQFFFSKIKIRHWSLIISYY